MHGTLRLVQSEHAGLASSHLTRRFLHIWQPYLDFLCPRRGPLRAGLGGTEGPGGPGAPGAVPTADIMVTFYRVVPKW